ncbi:hypothetical protein BDV18DRAFT_158227 [Aspergillus unguis]
MATQTQSTSPNLAMPQQEHANQSQPVNEVTMTDQPGTSESINTDLGHLLSDQDMIDILNSFQDPDANDPLFNDPIFNPFDPSTAEVSGAVNNNLVTEGEAAQGQNQEQGSTGSPINWRPDTISNIPSSSSQNRAQPAPRSIPAQSQPRSQPQAPTSAGTRTQSNLTPAAQAALAHMITPSIQRRQRRRPLQPGELPYIEDVYNDSSRSPTLPQGPADMESTPTRNVVWTPHQRAQFQRRAVQHARNPAGERQTVRARVHELADRPAGHRAPGPPAGDAVAGTATRELQSQRQTPGQAQAPTSNPARRPSAGGIVEAQLRQELAIAKKEIKDLSSALRMYQRILLGAQRKVYVLTEEVQNGREQLQIAREWIRDNAPVRDGS